MRTPIPLVYAIECGGAEGSGGIAVGISEERTRGKK